MITATHIAYFHICKRKLWLFSHGISMEQNSDLVTAGKLIGENSYMQRADKYTEVELEGIKIDFYDAKNKIVHEVKKSDKLEHAHIAQVKYYLFVLERNGIYGAKGVIEYPKLRLTEGVELAEQDRLDIPIWETEIAQIIAQTQCPPLYKIAPCKRCAYHDYCFIGE